MEINLNILIFKHFIYYQYSEAKMMLDADALSTTTHNPFCVEICRLVDFILDGLHQRLAFESSPSDRSIYGAVRLQFFFVTIFFFLCLLCIGKF